MALVRETFDRKTVYYYYYYLGGVQYMGNSVKAKSNLILSILMESSSNTLDLDVSLLSILIIK